jgi:hypothetical protein
MSESLEGLAIDEDAMKEERINILCRCFVDME